MPNQLSKHSLRVEKILIGLAAALVAVNQIFSESSLLRMNASRLFSKASGCEEIKKITIGYTNGLVLLSNVQPSTKQEGLDWFAQSWRVADNAYAELMRLKVSDPELNQFRNEYGDYLANFKNQTMKARRALFKDKFEEVEELMMLISDHEFSSTSRAAQLDNYCS